jgi:hypothetical protein
MLVSAVNPQTQKVNSGAIGALDQNDINQIWRATGTLEVPREYWPNLIVFADIGDPLSAIPLDPHDIAPPIGPGVLMRRAHITFTHEPITRGIDKRLPWLDRFPPSNPLFTGRLGVRVGDLGLGSNSFRR